MKQGKQTKICRTCFMLCEKSVNKMENIGLAQDTNRNWKNKRHV